MVQNRIMFNNQDAFTASQPMNTMSSGRYVDYLELSFMAQMTTGASVSVASTLALVNPFEVFLKGSPVIQMTAEDLYAFNVLVFKRNPFTVVATAATSDQTKIMGLKLPVWQPPRNSGELKYRATFNTVATTGSQTISVTEISDTVTLNNKYLHMVALPGTTAGATGYGNRVELGRIPGELEGILIRSATIPTSSAELATVQQVDLYANDVKIITDEWHNLKSGGPNLSLWSSPGDCSILDNFVFLDMIEDPILRNTNVRLDINAGVASSAFRIIPIYAI